MLETDGREAHTEVYRLLSEANHQFGRAIEDSHSSSFLDSSLPGVESGCAIFDATFEVLAHYHSEGELPVIGTDLTEGTPATIAALPILVAMAHFLDTSQTVCLKSYQLSSGNRHFDEAITYWPNTILWGLPAKKRFFYDLTELYAGTQVRYPLLSENRLRALQLLVAGRHLIERQLKKIGQPKKIKIFLPD